MSTDNRRGIILLTLVSYAFVTAFVMGCSNTSALHTNRVGHGQATVHSGFGYPMSYTTTEAARAAAFIFEGTVTKVGRACWNTADRKKPKQQEPQESIPPIVYTPYRVKVDKAYKGTIGSYVEVKSFSGTVGDDSFESEIGGWIPEGGEHVVIFASSMSSEKNGDVLAIPNRVYVVNGDKAVSEGGVASEDIGFQDLNRILTK